jgi:hypothetical protein
MNVDSEKLILDACCGGRMFWFNKKHPNAIYIDNRTAPKGHVFGNPNHEVSPDFVMDFRHLQFSDKAFKLVVFAPPHFSFNGPGGYIGKKYGTLNKLTWGKISKLDSTSAGAFLKITVS